jgi:hypothetical protein
MNAWQRFKGDGITAVPQSIFGKQEISKAVSSAGRRRVVSLLLCNKQEVTYLE